MVLGGALPVGSSRTNRLDPLALPVRFTANDAGADERQRQVEINRDRVVVRRAVRGMRMKVNLPLAAYLGVALRVVPAPDGAADAIAVSLEHRDPGSVRAALHCAPTATTWWRNGSCGRACSAARCWSPNVDGSLREPYSRLGAVRDRRAGAAASAAQRHQATASVDPAAAQARPRAGISAVHRDEREIIARN